LGHDRQVLEGVIDDPAAEQSKDERLTVPDEISCDETVGFYAHNGYQRWNTEGRGNRP